MKKLQWILVAGLLVITLSAFSLSATASHTSSSQSPIQTLHAENITSVRVLGGLPGTNPSPLFQNTLDADKITIAKLAGWIQAAKPVSGQTDYGKHGYPMVINIKMSDDQLIRIEPAYDCTSITNTDGSGTKTCTPVKNQLVLRTDSNVIRVASPPLYEWLQTVGSKNDKIDAHTKDQKLVLFRL